MTIKDSGTRRQFDSGAVRDMQEGKGRCDLLPACAILRVARHFEAGAKKYDDRNWEKGIPVGSFIDSAIRHLMKYLDGQVDEDHLCAAGWNILCAMWTEEKRPDLINIPTRPEYKTEGEREAYEATLEAIRKQEELEQREEERRGGYVEITAEGYIFKDPNGVEFARICSDGGYFKTVKVETREETAPPLQEVELVLVETHIGENGKLYALYEERTKL